MRRFVAAAAACATALPLLLSACYGDPAPTSLTLVAYDSFPTKDTPLNAALDDFTKETGIEVTVVNAGDAGTMVTKATLTAGTPEGDVMWGVDNTLLSAATEGNVFDGEPVQVDSGDVCVNIDLGYFADKGIAPPRTLDDLTDPRYRDQLVVENPATSSPGLAFLLATIARFGDDGWADYWTALRANGVKVVDSWESAYYETFSGAAGSAGDRPLVVSYGTSPPAEVVFSDPPIDPVNGTAPTGVATDTCFRQLEYAGILRGTKHADAAAKLVSFLTGERFQRELPLTLFVYPANTSVTLPEVFTRFGAQPTQPFTMEPDRIAAGRTQWQDQWTTIVLG
jgi:thiamine transport system substrate-binding protein